MKTCLKIFLFVSLIFITKIDDTAFAQINNQEIRHISESRKLKYYPAPVYTEIDTGTVVVNILVNRKGQIINAQFDSLKSTTFNKILINNSLKAARMAKFSKIATDIIESGQLTYHFKQ